MQIWMTNTVPFEGLKESIGAAASCFGKKNWVQLLNRLCALYEDLTGEVPPSFKDAVSPSNFTVGGVSFRVSAPRMNRSL
jgi:hypothetical protein